MKPATVALSLIATLFFARAHADPADDLWTQGRYEEAIKQGVSENTPEGLDTAARAAMAEMMLQKPPCLPCIDRAEMLARKALAADPKGALPTACLNAALGYRSLAVGPPAAYEQGLVTIMKQSLDEAAAAHPKNAMLVALLGNWNFQAVRAAGPLLARISIGATMDEGLKKYDEALDLAPNDIVINYLYGLGLAAYDPDGYRDKIVAAWKRVVAAPSKDAYDQMQKSRAGELLTLFNGNDRKAFNAKLRSYMGVPD